MTDKPPEDAPKRRRKPKPAPTPEQPVIAPVVAASEPVADLAKPSRTRSRKAAKPAPSPAAELAPSQLDLLAGPAAKPAPVLESLPVLESMPVLESLPPVKPALEPVLESLPMPAETPAAQPGSGPSMADRANRYARRPPPPVPERAPPPPPMSMADRARRSSQFHRGPEPAPADRPKPLDMAEIAARNRQARDAARVERLPEPVAQVVVPTAPRPAPTMAERSARHIQTHLVREEDRRQQPVAPAAPPPVPIAEPEGPSMAERAAEAAHRRREEGPAQRTGSPATAGPQAAIGSAAVVLVTRNHARVVRDRLRDWMALVSAVDVRWLVLDLGSTDDSVEEAERARARVVLRPGGLVQPLAAIDAVVREAAADIVLVIDADAEPHPAIIDLIGVVRAGHTAAVAPERHPVAMAVARQAWLAQARPDDVDATERAVRAGGMRRLSGGAVQPEITGLVARAVDAPPLRHLLKRFQRAHSLVRGVLRRFGR